MAELVNFVIQVRNSHLFACSRCASFLVVLERCAVLFGPFEFVSLQCHLPFILLCAKRCSARLPLPVQSIESRVSITPEQAMDPPDDILLQIVSDSQRVRRRTALFFTGRREYISFWRGFELVLACIQGCRSPFRFFLGLLCVFPMSPVSRFDVM